MRTEGEQRPQCNEDLTDAGLHLQNIAFFLKWILN